MPFQRLKLLNQLLFSLTLLSLGWSLSAQPVNCAATKQKYQCKQRHQMHLSFDDGVANKETIQVLNILKKHNIKATFFILGEKLDCARHAGKAESMRQCQERVQIIKRMKAEGHNIGAHGYQHHRHSEIPVAQMQQSIIRSKQVLAPYLNTNPPLFRLPYGDGYFNRKQKPYVLEFVKSQGFKHMAWEMTGYDWNTDYQHGTKILDNVMGQMCNGRGRNGVVLLHDGDHEHETIGRPFTAAHLDSWINHLKCSADFVSLQQLRKL